MIEEALETHLRADMAIAAVVVDRVYPHTIPQGHVLPAIIYTLIGRDHEHDMSGANGLAQSRFQITSKAKTYRAAKELAELVRQALQGQKGAFGGETIQSSLLVSERDDSDAADGNEEKKSSWVNQDYEIWHLESIPS